MNFDKIIDRRGTRCNKWDEMEKQTGVSAEDGLAMWVADMDFEPPQVVADAVQKMHADGIYGYYGDEGDYKAATQWWMQERHGWHVEADWIFAVHGLVNGTAMCVDTFTENGDGIILFTPVYHAFARVIKAAGRQVVECELTMENGRYTYDFDAYDAQMTGNEKMIMLCSPHNPGGNVWTRDELQGVIDFAKRHDLIIVSDEIHADLTMPGHTHLPLANFDGVSDRLVMMTAATKTFNIAAILTGNVIIPDDALRASFAARYVAWGISRNNFGHQITTAAYSPQGAAWVDALRDYLDGNRKLFDDGINAIPGLRSMNLEATYLAWVDFSRTGMTREEFSDRVAKTAKIAVNQGISFGKGGDSYLRFNIAMPRARIQEAVTRMQQAFADLQ